jgi:hypothetical protein
MEDSPARREGAGAGVLPRSFTPEQAKQMDYRLEIPLELLCTGDAGEESMVRHFIPV